MRNPADDGLLVPRRTGDSGLDRRHFATIALVVLIAGCPLKCFSTTTTENKDGGSTDGGPNNNMMSAQCMGPACDMTQKQASTVCMIPDSATLPQALTEAAAAVSGQFAYVGGGSTDGNFSATNTVYVSTIGSNGALGNFTATAPLPDTSGIAGAGMAASSGFLYFVGGEHLGAAANFPVATTFFGPIGASGDISEWTQGTSLPSPQAFLAVVLVDGFLYAIGGDPAAPDGGALMSATGEPSGPVFVAPVSAVDGSIGAWTSTTPLPGGRDKVAAAVFGNFIYVVGGGFKGWGADCDCDEVLVGEVNPANGTIASWTPVKAYTQASEAGGAAVVGNTLVVITGSNPGDLSGSPNILAASLASDGSIAGDWLQVASFGANPFSFSRAVAASATSVYSFGGTNGSLTAGNSPTLSGAEHIDLADGGVVCP